jgi:hypothetical protein
VNNVVTLTGSPLRTSPTPPTLRLQTCEITEDTRQLVPLNNCLLAIEAEFRRLLALLGGHTDEAAERIADIWKDITGEQDE